MASRTTTRNRAAAARARAKARTQAATAPAPADEDTAGAAPARASRSSARAQDRSERARGAADPELDGDALRRATRRRQFALIGGILAAAILVFAGFVASTLVQRLETPGDTSPDAGFARDMSDHHAQAVEMGMIAYQKATLPEVRTLGGDIALTQQGQIGVMQTWLTDWGLGPNSSQAPMSWMPEGQRALRGNLMPGMATREEVAKLRTATGKQVDILFCQYMLRHHLGGIHMVEGILAETHNQQVIDLATTMKSNQSGEVEVLRNLLTKLGAQPLPS